MDSFTSLAIWSILGGIVSFSIPVLMIIIGMTAKKKFISLSANLMFIGGVLALVSQIMSFLINHFLIYQVATDDLIWGFYGRAFLNFIAYMFFLIGVLIFVKES